MGSIEIKKQLIDAEDQLSVKRQCELLSIARSTYYHEAKGEHPENEKIMKMMDRHIQDEPTAGVLTMQSMLKDNGIKAGYE